MKLVTEFLSPGEAELAATHLEAAGIATYVSNGDSARIPVASSNAGGIGLWVVVDEQLDDACALLDNPDHEVRYVLTAAQKNEIQTILRDGGTQGSLGLLFQLLGVTMIFVLLVYLITKF